MNKLTHLNWPGYDHDNSTHRLITAYLTLDIQKSLEATDELLDRMQAVQTGQITEWERIGNAYCLRLLPEIVEIEEDYADEPGTPIQIPAPLFKTAVVAWRQQLLDLHDNP